jgi:hypothetical protein
MRSSALLLLLLLSMAFGLGLGASACVLQNPNHCWNLALDPNVWCSARFGEEQPYCSPCTAENYGCVSAEPSETECPEYSLRPNTETETESGATETDSGETETGSETDSGETETGETETGS